jgi:lipid A 3-O-deacylase
MRRVGAGLFLLSTLAVFVPAGSPARAEPPVAVTASAGPFSILDGGVQRYETGWEVSFAPRPFRWVPRFLQKTNPTLGVMATSRGTLYVYGGFRYDLPLGKSWWLSPQWATGLYYRDGGRELGGPLEFRSGIELSRRIGERSRLGVMLYHLSNAGIYGYNPGSESLVLTYTARP